MGDSCENCTIWCWNGFVYAERMVGPKVAIFLPDSFKSIQFITFLSI